MMDLKELIKWFFPGFYTSLGLARKMHSRLTFVCLFLLFNFITGSSTTTNSVSEPNRTFLYGDTRLMLKNSNLSSFKNDYPPPSQKIPLDIKERSLDESFSGRTFGRPFKKMIAGLLPIIFSMGAASTWAMVATIVGIKTLFVTLLILKLLLVAGAAKIGALFGAKQHYHPHYEHKEWTPQKEIHLHIHNGQHESHHEESYPPWSREGNPTASDSKNINVVTAADQPYPAGPQTIITPYGQYVRIDSAKIRKRRNNVAGSIPR